MTDFAPDEYGTTLSPADADALDALVDAAFDASAVAAEHQARAARLMGYFGLLERDGRDAVVDEAADEALVASTLAGIAAAADHTPHAEPIPVIRALDDARRMEPIPFRLSDVMAVAASFVILLGVLGPMLGAARTQARCQSCRARMLSAAHGFTAYGADYQHALPIAYDSLPEGGWMENYASSDNLSVLAANQYASLGSLGCPENPRAPKGWAAADGGFRWGSDEAISFSYQNLFGSDRPGWGDGRRAMPILSDRNPILDGIRSGGSPDASQNSASHGGQGQNVMRTDGSVCLLRSSEEAGDNIWLPSGLPMAKPILTGHEVPSSWRDSMLIH